MDKTRIIYGHLAMTDFSFGFISYDDRSRKWSLDEEEVKRHFSMISNAGANTIRVLPYAVWEKRPYGRRSQFCPWELDEAKNLWILSKRNGYYLDIMHRAFEIMNSVNLEVWRCWFDQCQLHAGFWTPMSPWKHNVEGVTSFYDEKAEPFVRAEVESCVKDYADLKLPDGRPGIFHPWGNELWGAKGGPLWARSTLFPLIRSLNVPFKRMTYGFVMGKAPYLGKGEFGEEFTAQDTARKFFGIDFPPEKNKTLITREVHNCGGPAHDEYCKLGLNAAQSEYNWGDKPPVGPFGWSDDGVEEWDNVADAGRPDADRLHYMMTEGLKLRNPIAFIEHCPENPDPEYQADVIEATSLAYYEHFGFWPENHGQWPYIPPPPPPPPPPPVEYITSTVCESSMLLPNAWCPELVEMQFVKGTEPGTVCGVHKKPEPKSCYDKYIAGRPMRKWQVGKFLSCWLWGKK